MPVDLQGNTKESIPDPKKLRRTQGNHLREQVVGLKMLCDDMPSAEFERHCYEVRRNKLNRGLGLTDNC